MSVASILTNQANRSVAATAAAQTNAATNGTSAAPTATTSSSASQTISTQDFMELLSTEMANQDPLQPMDPTQTLTQLAQFSTLTQTSTLNQNQSLATANMMLGATVTVPGQNGATPTTGVVTAVDSSQVATGGAPQLVVNGSSTEIPVTSVTQVQITQAPGSTSTSSSTPSSSTTPSTN